MGREVRKVPKAWEHPKRAGGGFEPLYEGCDLTSEVADYESEKEKWARGEFPSYCSEESKELSYEDWAGPPPNTANHMPNWPEAERTHFMMYEDTSEGTPISPAFETPEALAKWLVDNRASAFGSQTASYEGWLRVARGGLAPAMIGSPATGFASGVEYCKNEDGQS